MQLHNDELIKKWEALRLVAYLPTPNDVWTIGWGHTKGVKPGDEISREQAQILFIEDVEWAVAAVNKKVKVGLTQNQFDSLVSLVFNIGETNFAKSTLLRRLNAGNYDEAAEQFHVWNKQRQNGKLVVLKGLVRRRAQEAEVFMSLDEVEVAPQILTETSTSGILKPLFKSKEVIGGSVAGATGLLSALGGLTPSMQDKALTAACVALVAFGVYVVFNRLLARRKGQR